MPITVQATEESSTIRLDGEIDINCSDELKSALVKALSGPHALQLEVGGITGVDVTAVQLLWAAARSAEKAGKPFLVADALAERVRDVVREAGFTEFPPPTARSNPQAPPAQTNPPARRR